MKRANRFSIAQNWKLLLDDIDIDSRQVLERANLPESAFDRPDASLSSREYFQMWQAMDDLSGDRELPLLIAKAFSVEFFDPALFACVCSKNLAAAAQRISEFKPLIGPMRIEISTVEEQLQIDIKLPYDIRGLAPVALSLTELVFFTQLARLTTRSHVVPTYLSAPFVVRNNARYEEYFGNKILPSNELRIRFSEADAQRPFLTASSKMWLFFEERLRTQLRQLSLGATIEEHVRGALIELLPTGNATVDQVASALTMSKRSLQRKLAAENFSFQNLLQSVRVELADHYLEKSRLPLSEISFLLGFHEPNSFIRAYTSWKGQSPGQHRQQTIAKLTEEARQEAIESPG